MKKILIVLALAAAVLGVSCDRPEEPQVKPTLTVSPSELAFAASGNSSKTVTVTAENVGWEITMSDESKAWITVTENSDGKTLTVSVSDNEAETARNGSFTLTPDNVKVDPKRVTVSQEGAEVGDLSFSLDPTALTFDGGGCSCAGGRRCRERCEADMDGGSRRGRQGLDYGDCLRRQDFRFGG